MARKYATTSIETTLSAGISSTATSITVANASNLIGEVALAGGSVDQFACAIEPDTINEEVVFVTAINTTTNILTIVRGVASTGQLAHAGGSLIKHVLTGEDMTYFETNVQNSASSTTTFTNKTINLASNTLTGTTAQFNTALSDNDFATLAGSEALTNKNLTGAGNTFPTSLVTLTGTQALTNKDLTGVGNTFPTSLATLTDTQTLTNKNLSSATNTFPTSLATLTGTQALTNKDLTGTGNTFPTSLATLTGTQTITNKDLTSATNTFPTSLVTLTGSQTLSNKTLTSPIISSISNTGVVTLPTATDTLVARTTTDTLTNKYLQAPNEVVNIVGTGFAGYTFDVLSGGVVFITANATANGTLNFRGNSGTTLNSVLAVGQSVSLVLLVTNGGTAFYPTAFQIDGTSVTPRFVNGAAAPTAGNVNSIDSYSFTIIKTAATPTYTVLASGPVKF